MFIEAGNYAQRFAVSMACISTQEELTNIAKKEKVQLMGTRLADVVTMILDKRHQRETPSAIGGWHPHFLFIVRLAPPSPKIRMQHMQTL